MDYISVREAAENWEISVRRVQKLCEQGRIPDAEHVGRAWLLPKDAERPEDKRQGPKSEKAKGTSSFRLTDNPLSMLRAAWALKTRGKDSDFNVLLDELLPTVKAREDEPGLYGEWLLLSSFRRYPHLSEMIPVLKQAAPYFNGKCSRVILPTSLFPFANCSVFSIYHIKSGSAEDEARLLEEYISLYALLTGGHGTGADILYSAEMLFLRGDLNMSEILAYKAFYLAREKKQDSVMLTAAFQLGHIAVWRADTDGLQSAIKAMYPIHKGIGNSSDALQSIFDALNGLLLLELTRPDPVTDWLKAGDFERLHGMPQFLPFAHFVHAQYLCRKGEFARLIGFAEALYPDGIDISPVLDALLSLTIASAYLNTGGMPKAETLIRRAADRVLPDGLVCLLASYLRLLGGGLMEPIIRKAYPACLHVFHMLKSQLYSGARRLGEHIATITRTDGLPEDLTPRELEVALLAAQGLRNAEISEQLSITENTVRFHLRSVFHKLDVDRRVKLAEKLS